MCLGLPELVCALAQAGLVGLPQDRLDGQTNSSGLALQGLVVTQLDVQPGECIKVKGKILSDAKG